MNTRQMVFASVGGAVLVAAVCAGCVPDSKYPVTEIEEATADEAIIGTWKVVTKSGETHFLHIGREQHRPLRSGRETPEPALMRFTLIVHSKQGGLEEPLSGRFFVSEVRGVKYANMVLPLEVSDNEPQPAANYWIVRYETDGHELRVRGMDIRAAARAIEQGFVEGTVERRDNKLRRVTLLASGETLREFFASEAASDLFPESNQTVYTRVR